jgi:hypothetical protein
LTIGRNKKEKLFHFFEENEEGFFGSEKEEEKILKRFIPSFFSMENM